MHLFVTSFQGSIYIRNCPVYGLRKQLCRWIPPLRCELLYLFPSPQESVTHRRHSCSPRSWQPLIHPSLNRSGLDATHSCAEPSELPVALLAVLASELFALVLSPRLRGQVLAVPNHHALG